MIMHIFDSFRPISSLLPATQSYYSSKNNKNINEEKNVKKERISRKKIK
jgi:hypothetical protein